MKDMLAFLQSAVHKSKQHLKSETRGIEPEAARLWGANATSVRRQTLSVADL